MSGSPKRSSHTDERSLAQPNALTSRPRGREAGAAPVELAASSWSRADAPPLTFPR